MPNHKTWKWLACVGVVGLVGAGTAVGLVGSAGAVSSSSKAAKRVSGAPVTTASFNFTAAVSGLAPSPVDVSGSGQVDVTTSQVSLSVKLPAVVAKRLPGGSASPETVKAVLAGGTVYLDVPGLSSLVGKPWISVALPAADAAAASGILSKVAAGLGNVNAIVHLAAAHHATVTPLGGAVVNGVSVTGEKIAATLPKRQATTITASVWANSSGQLVQGKVQVSATTKKHKLDIGATLNLSGYGNPVSITVPPPAQVKAIPFATVESVIGSFLPKGLHAHLTHGHHHPLRSLSS
jgi:hypothetical protein